MTYTINTDTAFLNKLFDELRADGYIYNEPNEDGTDMSYGEYAAVYATFDDCLCDDILKIYDFEEAFERLKAIIEDTSDDIRIFYNLEQYEEFEYYFDEEAGTMHLYNVPENLKEHFENLAEEYEQNHQPEYEEDYEYAA